MFRIVAADFLAPEIKRFVIEAPRIARKRQAGQFVIVRVYERGERIPLTIADGDPERGTITLIVQGIGKTTKLMNLLGPGDALLDLVGPLGKPSEIKNYGTVVVIGGGVGAAIAYPTAKAMHEAGNHVISILGGRSRDLVILESEIRAISDEVFVTTDDGSYGRKGLVIDPLKELIAAGRPLGLVLAIGPPRMMQAVAEVTRPHRDPHGRQPQLADGGRHRHVRRLPDHHLGRRQVRLRGRPRVRRPHGGLRHPRPAEPDLRRPRGGGAARVPGRTPTSVVREVRESCRLEAAHPEVRHP